MLASFVKSAKHRTWFRRAARALVLVTQLVVLVAPLAEAHDEQPLRAHVEAPRTVPHPGHHVDNCPACMLLTVHGCLVQRARLEVFERERCVAPRLAAVEASSSARSVSNSSRAPPSAS